MVTNGTSWLKVNWESNDTKIIGIYTHLSRFLNLADEFRGPPNSGWPRSFCQLFPFSLSTLLQSCMPCKEYCLLGHKAAFHYFFITALLWLDNQFFQSTFHSFYLSIQIERQNYIFHKLFYYVGNKQIGKFIVNSNCISMLFCAFRKTKAFFIKISFPLPNVVV